MMKTLTTALLLTLSISSAAATAEPRIIENGGTGPHSAVVLQEASLPTHTIFRPKNISGFKATHRLPVIAWGNGACFDSPWEHVNFLNEIASHGFIVIAIGTLPPEGVEPAKERSTSSKLTDAIDWAVAQNSDKASYYFDTINTDSIAVAGMSCGGLQALEVAGDPRITALLIANSGILIDPIPGDAALMMPKVKKSDLKKIHTPTFYLLGGPSDIAYNNGMDDVSKINQVPVYAANLDVGHGGTYGHPHGGAFAKLATAWFQWQLNGDGVAGGLFVGNPPGIAALPGWTFDSKMPSKP